MKEFVRQGAFVAFGDIDETNGARVVAEAGPSHVVFVKCNVAVWEDQVRLFRTAVARSPTKSVNVVVQNAGISGKDPIWWDGEVQCSMFRQTTRQSSNHDIETDENGEPLQPDLKILDTNLVGCLYTTKLALHHFARQDEAPSAGAATTTADRCLILMSSIAGYCEQPGAPVYGASKHGIRGVMQSLRRTAHQRGVRVNLLAPWYIDTPAIPRTSIEPLTSKGVRWARTEDAAQAAVHVAFDGRLHGELVVRRRSVLFG